MTVNELAPGLWRWTAPHPSWTPERGGSGGWEQAVGCIYYEATDAVVLIDPLVPAPGTTDERRFWTALDRDVERMRLPVSVLVGNTYHGRSADAIVARYADRFPTAVHVSTAAERRASCTATRLFEDGAGLPGGVQAHPIAGLDAGETAFWLPERRALVFADAVIGTEAGTVRVAPRSWAAEGEQAGKDYANGFRADLTRLVELDPLLLLPSHGEPVLEGGAAALAAAVRGPAWGED